MRRQNLTRCILLAVVRRRLWIIIMLGLAYISISWMNAPIEEEKPLSNVPPQEPPRRNIHIPRMMPAQPDTDFEFKRDRAHKKAKPDFIPKPAERVPERKATYFRNIPKEMVTEPVKAVSKKPFLQAFERNEKMVNPHDFHYIHVCNHLCGDSSVFLLVLVHSAPNHSHERTLIRQTWGSVKSYKNQIIKVVFLLAKPKVASIQEAIDQEYELYRDIVQEDFIDHYRNLTHKHLMGYKFVLTYCHQVKFVAKVDDDTFINIFRLVRFLMRTYSTEGITDLLYCSVFINIGPRRDKDDKWYVSHEEYADDMYPPWCEGFAYVISPDLIHKLYQLSLFTKYYWIDDVYVTGILVHSLGFHHIQFRDPNGYAIMSDSFASPKVNDVLFLLAKYIKMHDTWADIWHAAVKYSQLGLPEQRGIQLHAKGNADQGGQRLVRNGRPHDTIL